MKSAITAILALSLCAFAAEKEQTKATPAASQPAVETLDLETIARIRDEGINDSHIMEYASGLFDGVGSRLTGSPDFLKAQQWSLDQFRRMGVECARRVVGRVRHGVGADWHIGAGDCAVDRHNSGAGYAMVACDFR